MITFTCAACAGTFDKTWTDEDAAAEAEATFTPEEMREAVTVCEGCWREMRHDNPDLDARYFARPQDGTGREREGRHV